ncbi:MAG: hypothetical protein ACRESZ_21720 [Methylococcales bacterium]
MVVGSAYTTWADISQGDPAMWEFKHLLELTLTENKRVIAEAHGILDDCPDSDVFQIKKPSDIISDCDKRRNTLARYLKEQQPQQKRSITHTAYIISLFVQVFTLGAGVISISSLLYYRSQIKLNLYSTDKLIAVVFFLYILWIPIRVFALEEKANLYLNVEYLTELPITILVIICYIYSLRLTWLASKDFMTPIVQALAGGVLLVVAITHPYILSVIIGRTSNPATYPLITIVVFLVISPLIIGSEKSEIDD